MLQNVLTVNILCKHCITIQKKKKKKIKDPYFSMGKNAKSYATNTPLSIFSLGKGRESLCLKPYIRKLTHNTKFEHFHTQKDANFRNTIIICDFGLENPQNPTQKDRNFEKMHSLTSAKNAHK